MGGHYGVYGGYGRMYQTARIYPLQQFYKKAGYDGILFNDREIVAFDSNQISTLTIKEAIQIQKAISLRLNQRIKNLHINILMKIALISCMLIQVI